MSYLRSHRRNLSLAVVLLSVVLYTVPVFAGEGSQLSDEQPNSADTGDTADLAEIEKMIDGMPLEDKVAQMFIVTPEQLAGSGEITEVTSELKSALDQYAVGGFICYEYNIVSEDQIREFTSGLQETSRYPLFLCVDEEGGIVANLEDSLDLEKVGTAGAIGDTLDTELAYEAGVTLGTYVTSYGFNVDFAPVADVGLVESAVMNSRYYSSDPETDADMVAAVTEGIQSTGASATLKHFPGHGSTADNSHTGAAVTTRTLEEMYETEFLPFEAGIGAGADMVMMGHISAPNAADGDEMPASLSPLFATDILRDSLGFDGVIVTDAMNMAAVTNYFDAGEAAVKAVEAGVDQILMPEDFELAYNTLLAAVNDGTISEERIDESLRRIYKIKLDIPES